MGEYAVEEDHWRGAEEEQEIKGVTPIVFQVIDIQRPQAGEKGEQHINDDPGPKPHPPPKGVGKSPFRKGIGDHRGAEKEEAVQHRGVDLVHEKAEPRGIAEFLPEALEKFFHGKTSFLYIDTVYRILEKTQQEVRITERNMAVWTPDHAVRIAQ